VDFLARLPRPCLFFGGNAAIRAQRLSRKGLDADDLQQFQSGVAIQIDPCRTSEEGTVASLHQPVQLRAWGDSIEAFERHFPHDLTSDQDPAQRGLSCQNLAPHLRIQNCKVQIDNPVEDNFRGFRCRSQNNLSQVSLPFETLLQHLHRNWATVELFDGDRHVGMMVKQLPEGFRQVGGGDAIEASERFGIFVKKGPERFLMAIDVHSAFFPDDYEGLLETIPRGTVATNGTTGGGSGWGDSRTVSTR